MASNKFYLTTAIDYVNARPHCGHAFEKTIADALARYQRLEGKDVFFLTGVDENAQKNVQAAEKAGIPTKEFIDKNAALFVELCKKLSISYDDFIRTTAKEHAVVVQRILKKIIDKKDIYKGEYSGLYCVGCETYYTEKDLIDGRCPEHNTKPEVRKEEAYFFKLSKYKDKLLKLIPSYIIPESRKNEIISRIKEKGLNDICISRKGAKWGIDFPNDKNYKIWVWVDALINYISGLKDKENKYWPADVHVIGKGINFFHSVIWPALLMSAGYKLADKLMVHGYLNIGGKKMSKSLGNVLDPLELLEKYPSDTIRYSLLRNSMFEDSDYSEEIIIIRHNNELADKLGNLVSRVSTLAEKYGIEKVQIKALSSKKTQDIVRTHLENLELDKAIQEIFSFIDKCNEFVQSKKPWETHDKKVLYELSNAIKDVAVLLSPFIPQTAEKIASTFNFDISLKSLNTDLKPTKIKKADILFKKIDMAQKSNQEENKKDDHRQENKKPQSSDHSTGDNNSSGNSKISYNDFSKVHLKIGKILKVEDHPKADKLYVLTVDLGENKPRTIVAGLRLKYKKEDLQGKKAVFVANLAPVNLRGIESDGMILAAATDDDSHVIFLTPEKDIKQGSKIR